MSNQKNFKPSYPLQKTVWPQVGSSYDILKKSFLGHLQQKWRSENFWPKLRMLTKTTISDKNIVYWPKFLFLTKASIFDQSFYFWPTFRFLTKASILTKISIFDRNFDFWQKTSTFDQSIDFWHRIWPKFRFWTKTSNIDRNPILITLILLLTIIFYNIFAAHNYSVYLENVQWRSIFFSFLKIYFYSKKQFARLATWFTYFFYNFF